MIKVARVSTVPFFVISQLKDQINFLSQAGFDVTVITSSTSELNGIFPPSVTTASVSIPRKINPVQDLMALISLLREFRARRYDIVHSTTPKAGLISMVAAALARCPIRLHTFTGQTWVTLGGPMRAIAKLADRIIALCSTHCYADSPSQRDFLVNSRIVPPGKISVIGQGSLAGVNLERFDRSKYSKKYLDSVRDGIGIPSNHRVVIFVGRITEEKGIVELFDAFQKLRCEDNKLSLLLVGPVEAQVSLEKMFKYPGVHHIGYTPEPELYMAVSDVFALPSYREGFGTVIIEAAAMGLPAVGSEIYGLSDAIVNDVTGILVPSRSKIELYSALKRVLTDTNLRERLSMLARKRVELHFDSNVVNSAVVDEYHKHMRKRHY